ncbi:uncharacterized protein N7459_002057 [Penicillium hispanicum]|uniref:uncharacterized protein n=1 Tax=Penicillium hispanicum TaxID=1080232 RepID=UPI0025417EDA|nr:uncharacterized protein N7459_002057 [Penicillium hispanicum]KAJ5591688.1 hypothetical protein N7459_002057 [Penicillium hispanicum]
MGFDRCFLERSGEKAPVMHRRRLAASLVTRFSRPKNPSTLDFPSWVRFHAVALTFNNGAASPELAVILVLPAFPHYSVVLPIQRTSHCDSNIEPCAPWSVRLNSQRSETAMRLGRSPRDPRTVTKLGSRGDLDLPWVWSGAAILHPGGRWGRFIGPDPNPGTIKRSPSHTSYCGSAGLSPLKLQMQEGERGPPSRGLERNQRLAGGYKEPGNRDLT